MRKLINESALPLTDTLLLVLTAVHSFADIRSEDELSQLFPEAVFPTCPEVGATLEGSMEQLKKGLESGTVLIQFEVRDCEGRVPRLGLNASGGCPVVAESPESPGGLSSWREHRGAHGQGGRAGLGSRGQDHSLLLNSASPSCLVTLRSHGESCQKSRRRDSEPV